MSPTKRWLKVSVLLVFNVILLFFVFTSALRTIIHESKIRNVLASTFDDNIVPLGNPGNQWSLGRPNASSFWQNLFLSDFLQVGALSSAPLSPFQGAIYFDTSSSTFSGYNGLSWNSLIDPFWQANGSNIYNVNSGNVGIGTVNPDEALTVTGGAIRTDRSYKDIFSWQTNSKYQSNLSLAYNMGGFGGGVVSPGNNFVTTTGWSAYDATNTGGANKNKGYIGAVFDGRYVYFVPYRNSVLGYDGIVLRYDTTQSFNGSSAWASYDAGNSGGLTNTKGYIGAVFDGRYIYFVPYWDGSGFSGKVLRYDTTQSFSFSGSWSAYDAGSISKAYAGAVFDGHYIYFVPFNPNNAVVRYDTTQSFTAAGSWTGYTPTGPGYKGAVFDGRYVYFVPGDLIGGSGVVLRYDTTQSFGSGGSWSTYDASGTSGLTATGYFGAVFDGRYIYFVPYNNINGYHGVVLRYDTSQPFTSPSSWVARDSSNTNGLNTTGYSGAVFDGRFIYFIPNVNSASVSHGVVLRYDANQSFNAASSWSAYDASSTSGLTTTGYVGAVFDGRYVYLSPYGTNGSSGVVLRFDTGSTYPQQSLIQEARSNDFFIDSNSNIGIHSTTPLTYKLQIGGGDIGTDTAGNGLILKSPNGLVCERIGIDNSGNVTSAAVTCP